MSADTSKMPAGSVKQVKSKRELKAFLRLPWSIYRRDPYWVPPLRRAAAQQFDPARNVFFEHADMRLFLAWRNCRPVGRIAAIVNHLHNSYHQDSRGFWGFFECENNPDTAEQLLNGAGDWLRKQGMTEMQGPFNPSINSECGFLTEGFDSLPALLMPYNKPYYPHLMEEAGHQKAKDLLAYDAKTEDFLGNEKVRNRLTRLAKVIRKRHPDIRVRSLNKKNLQTDVLTLGRLFNNARENNWAFVPSTEAELREMARELHRILDPELVLVAEVKGEIAGCMFALPDVNPLLRKIARNPFSLAWISLLTGRLKVKRMRVFGAACLPPYRNMGVTPLLFHEFTERAIKGGYESAEISWVAEDNTKSAETIISAIQPTLYKRYRVYQQALT